MNRYTDKLIALAGNPNVGKSTVFNALTGLHQHTGNWPGKTVESASGQVLHRGIRYTLADIPGTYSLMAHSREEEVARDFICFSNPDAVIVVCDATCLERNLNLLLQTLEITGSAVLCVNLMDEAEKKSIHIDLPRLSQKLGIPVIGTSARRGKNLPALMDAVQDVVHHTPDTVLQVQYITPVENALNKVADVLKHKSFSRPIGLRWLALRLIEGEPGLVNSICNYTGYDFSADEEITAAVTSARKLLDNEGISGESFADSIVTSIIKTAEDLCSDTVFFGNRNYNASDRKTDKLLTGRLTGIPIMLFLLCAVFFLTISGANVISSLLSRPLFALQDILLNLCIRAGVPPFVYNPLILGVYRVTAWVVSVMLPPMAIFFPLFTLLEDLGYLPRVAFNLDKTFRKCCACGKQALTMCMGFGCNAAGVIGCRIIDSPRERLIAILTNNFVPCNGRFPMLISIITMFFAAHIISPFQGIAGAVMLTAVVMLGICATFLVSFILSKTLLRGTPSSFTLELPPYRRPDIGRVLIRSVFDRTLFVLGRAVSIAAPTGLVIWLLANISPGGVTLISRFSTFLDPFARCLGLDGVILAAFILGLPANEIVIPIIVMTYLSGGTLTELQSLSAMHTLFTDNGWTWLTAVNIVIFSLMHWPCSTTLLTIKKETGSIGWTVLSAVIPTVIGMTLCFLFTCVARLF